MNCYVRFFNSVYDTKNIKVMMGDNIISKKLNYPKFTEYFKCVSGTHEVKIYKDDELIYREDILINEGDILTCCLAGNCMFYDLFTVLDKKENHSNTVAEMRFVNLVPYDTKCNIYLDKTLTVEGLDYREVSNFYELQPKNYKMLVSDYYTDKPKVIHPRANVKDKYIYTTYIVGNYKEKNGLLIVNSLEGSTYITE